MPPSNMNMPTLTEAPISLTSNDVHLLMAALVAVGAILSGNEHWDKQLDYAAARWDIMTPAEISTLADKLHATHDRVCSAPKPHLQ